MRRAAALAAALLAAPAGATTSTDILREPLSPRQAAQGGLYGSYDVFKAFSNPALLANQPHTWEFALTEQLMFGGSQNRLGLAAGFAGQPGESGTFGAGLLLSNVSIPAFEEVAISGDTTGVTIDPSLLHVGLAGLYVYQFMSLGVAVHAVNTSFGDLPQDDGAIAATGDTTVGFDIGTTLTLGRLDLGIAYHVRDSDSIDFGAALRFSKFGFGFNLDLPFAVSPDTSNNQGGAQTQTAAADVVADPLQVAAGFSWKPHEMLLLRLGGSLEPAVADGRDAFRLRFGFTVPWKQWSFDYATTFDPENSIMQHMLAASYWLGRDRKMPEGPRFFLKQEERTLAVANFDPQNVSSGDAAVISDMIRNQLIREGAFNVVEKANMEKVLQEQAFQQTGCTTQECAVKLGKILNVRYLLVGSFGKALDQYVVSVRVVDVETAKAIYSDESYGKNLPEVRDGITAICARMTEAVKKVK